jgi:hypothetical protein
MKIVSDWPKDITMWTKDRTLYLSIPFTWLLPKAIGLAAQRSMWWDRVVVGGPAIALMPEYLSSVDVEIGQSYPGILQRVNWQATKTTEGCPNSCPFCAVPRIEGQFRELDDWPDLPVLVDNNLLAASQAHLDRVFDKLERWGWADFNQGLDARRLDEYHAERLARIGKPVIRLALDHPGMKDEWTAAYNLLRKYKIPKAAIRSYALVGFRSDPAEAWKRCQWIEGHGVKVLPMWFHELDALQSNAVTDRQRELGWDDYERRRIMQWFYQHKEAVR